MGFQKMERFLSAGDASDRVCQRSLPDRYACTHFCVRDAAILFPEIPEGGKKWVKEETKKAVSV